MADKTSSAELEANEVALILGKDGTKMTVRIHAATEPQEGDDIPEPFHVAVALAMRLLEDPEFHDDVLDWYEEHEDDEEGDEDEEGGDDEGGDEEGGDDEESDDADEEEEGKKDGKTKG